ncbi:Rieske 2Fe-2S domain-containing protein [Massilia sp. Root335]|jgi:nitrite reductase/ring-hydroxylating ferredoxin subunit|uniref:Rieske (2Fe-2S) protein n=1 Tax=Massilia sp. Root335 TaxID=1736517 RepID=UPI0006F8AC62|nr:Rieske 2Fe-2S domain-containing protein [Massilia sp. Root335]KQV41073.1 Rieske (2Fe-2S) protein [Massilia sp. Root335]
MSDTEDVYICESATVEDGGEGIRFPVRAFGEDATGFVVRFRGRVYAYLNRCAHVPIELDWSKGEFFESSKLYLMCSTHGAIYAPESGACAGGPCRGGKLRPIVVREADDRVYWQPDQHIRPPAPGQINGVTDSQTG